MIGGPPAGPSHATPRSREERAGVVRRPLGKRPLAALAVLLALGLAVGFGLRSRHGGGTGGVAASAGTRMIALVEGKPGAAYPYTPATIHVRAGRAFQVRLTDNLGGCGLETVFPGLGGGGQEARLVVPVGQTRLITLRAARPGRYRFHCASNMYFGTIVAA